ncbi:2-succinyl-5-enolpyruvyl-6-hydroxy-3-cyclohexene-1-carboxylic-acid synthase [Myxococcota bacterium]|nr:2-succinyl-5-enolpyruvyl-6-hydroxy-3-cyclohexene-1-carboxylic-acid synthase [Myxococcota bacterium]MCZ7617728.1 2-succinyl-5-enolpyruvyl-6-hydroxy-3-cyclohexene-1-carboxylic-acid synthase [Myxococcota bacterium]
MATALPSGPAAPAAPAFANANAAFAAALFDEFARAGIRHVCVCPGSRSAPLAIAAARAPGLRVWTHLDERAAAFFALGIAKASRTAVALVCTSGTAAANFLPAVVEAHLARVPLLVLTADRPAELRDWGAAQTIDQVRLFGSHARWFAELPLPEPHASLLRHVRATAARAVAVASGRPAGPVHLNVPYREPLAPVAVPDDVAALAALDASPALRGRPERPYLRLDDASTAPSAPLVERLVRDLRAARRGILLAGPDDRDPALAAALAKLARTAGWPLLADGASPLRTGSHVGMTPICGAHDAFLRVERFAARHTPDLVLRFGAPPTSQATARWLEHSNDMDLRLVDAEGGFADPSQGAAEIVRADPVALCHALADAWGQQPGRTSETWLSSFQRAESAAQGVLTRGIETAPLLCAPAVVRALAAALPHDAVLFASNSMAVRDVDSFLSPAKKPLRVLVSRGANGIDGIPSTALGAAAALETSLALLTGDLAFLHDVGGLLAARRHGLSVLCVVVNDDGGGIFSYLPVAGYGEDAHFEDLFTTPHGVDLAHATALAGGRHVCVTEQNELEEALGRACAEPGLQVVEARIAREANVAHHRALWAAVAGAVAQEFGA